MTEAPPRAFFSGNSFYTTSANRMARGLLPEAVTAEDVIQACGGNLPPAPELPDSGEPLPEPEEASADYKPKPLPWWRKLGAVLTGTVSFLLFLSFMNVTDLTQLITADGMTELANHQMILYALLFSRSFCLLPVSPGDPTERIMPYRYPRPSGSWPSEPLWRLY